MKKILIIFSLILSLFINVVPVQAMEYATSPDMAISTTKIGIKVHKNFFNDFEFILNVLENPSLEVYFYSTGETYIYDFESTYLFSSEGTYYFQDFTTNQKYYYDTSSNNGYCYDIYLLDDNGNRIYKTYVNNATDNYVWFTSFSPYVEEDNKDDENPEDSESTEEPESPDDSGSTEDEGSQISQGDIKVLHNDLMILIIIVGFFEFMKMINIIVRNISGGDK